ncbi:MAG: hypothetical protein QNJ00_01830 [Woeseiaceae bacterium]|nr:hypothetical protein [Woeseiaceae bacterium]
MTTRQIIAFLIYIAWCGFNIAVAAVPIGDGGVVAHLALTITGLPSSFVSWFLPHGSLQGVMAAAVLGAVQLVLLFALLNRQKN